jgi:hypothetical protein
MHLEPAPVPLLALVSTFGLSIANHETIRSGLVMAVWPIQGNGNNSVFLKKNIPFWPCHGNRYLSSARTPRNKFLTLFKIGTQS